MKILADERLANIVNICDFAFFALNADLIGSSGAGVAFGDRGVQWIQSRFLCVSDEVDSPLASLLYASELIESDIAT